ncbi:MAG: rRNA pseudouridine synthase [bacterium]|nr:rRNA pseudouridine synthase [bacterium]
MTRRKRFEKQPPPEPWRAVRRIGLARALQKAGWGTRRRTEILVESGRVAVDGKLVEDPRIPVETSSVIEVDGEVLTKVPFRYYAFHKPFHVVCTGNEASGKRMVEEFLPRDVPGLRPAGRLDSRTTGLLLVSNDPTWNNRAATSGGGDQEFRIQVEGELNELEIGVITAGVHLPNLGLFRPLSVRIIEKMNNRTVIVMTVREGKVRQIRRMFTTLRHKITLLRRIRIGDIRLGDLVAGSLRPLSQREVALVAEAKMPIAPASGEGVTT